MNLENQKASCKVGDLHLTDFSLKIILEDKEVEIVSN